MLETISWNNYFSALAVGVTLYYIIVTFLFYRNELIHWFQHPKKPQNPAAIQENPILGSVRHPAATPPAQSTITTSQLHLNHQPESLPEDEVSLLPHDEWHIQEDAREVRQHLHALLSNETTSEPAEIVLLLKTLFANYTQLINTPHQTELSTFAAEKLQCPVTEVLAWWPDAPTMQTKHDNQLTQ